MQIGSFRYFEDFLREFLAAVGGKCVVRGVGSKRSENPRSWSGKLMVGCAANPLYQVIES
jgi:hypothetical protein